jgi:hypothetical protein
MQAHPQIWHRDNLPDSRLCRPAMLANADELPTTPRVPGLAASWTIPPLRDNPCGAVPLTTPGRAGIAWFKAKESRCGAKDLNRKRAVCQFPCVVNHDELPWVPRDLRPWGWVENPYRSAPSPTVPPRFLAVNRAALILSSRIRCRTTIFAAYRVRPGIGAPLRHGKGEPPPSISGRVR